MPRKTDKCLRTDYRFLAEISLVSSQASSRFRRRAPQIIFAAIIIVVVAYVLFEVLEDVLIEGTPLTSGPLLWLWNGIIFITRNVTSAVSSWGYAGIFGLMLLESSSLPIPSEVILPFAGYLVATGKLNFWVCLTAATVAGVVGALVDYYVGLKGAHVLADHRVFGKTFFTKAQAETVVHWFVKYGNFAVLFSRLVPGFRTVVSFPAGAAKMPLARFVAYTTAGCLAWNGLLIYLGVFLGENWNEVAGVLHYLIIAAAATIVVVVVAYVLVWWRRRVGSPTTKA